MKKVLCGLVIALMMTGSGYANLDRDQCKYLINEAEKSVLIGQIFSLAVDKEADRLAMEGSNDDSSIEHGLKNELDALKRAHYYAVIWSSLCD